MRAWVLNCWCAGFLSHQASKRKQKLKELKSLPTTIILYESTHRLMDLLADVKEIYGENISIVLAKELTKKFEAVISGSADNIVDWLTQDENRQNGEFVILINNKFIEKNEDLSEQTKEILASLLNEVSVKTAVELTEKITQEHKKQIYAYAIKLNQKK